MFFEDNIDNAKYCGHLYGLGTTFIVNGNYTNSSNESTAENTTTLAWADPPRQASGIFMKNPKLS